MTTSGVHPAADRPPGDDDHLEWARHYWRRHDLGEHEDAFIAMSAVLRFHRVMVDMVETAVRPLGLNVTDYMLLVTLQLSEDGKRLISQLARSLLIHATTATLACDRLEAKRLIERHTHPTDRRATVVALTQEGQLLLREATGKLQQTLFGLAGSSVETQRELIEVLAQLRAAAGGDPNPGDRSPRSPSTRR